MGQIPFQDLVPDHGQVSSRLMPVDLDIVPCLCAISKSKKPSQSILFVTNIGIRVSRARHKSDQALLPPSDYNEFTSGGLQTGVLTITFL